MKNEKHHTENMSNDLASNIEKLIDSGYGDYGRLTAILEAVRKGKILYSSDQQYVDNLISKHLTPTEHVVEQKNENTESDPLSILNKRLASGEIKEKEYDKLRKKLKKEEKSNNKKMKKKPVEIEYHTDGKSAKKKMSVKKKVGIGIGIVVIMFFVLVIITAAISNPQVEQSTPVKLSEPEIKAKAINVSYDDLMRNNENYVGKIVHYKGQVDQAQNSFDNNYILRVSVTPGEFSTYTDDVWINYQGQRILDGDIVEFWGEVKGIKTYKAVLGNEIAIPEIDSEILNVVQKKGQQ